MGAFDGEVEGLSTVGFKLGLIEGSSVVGLVDGPLVGICDGAFDGELEGLSVVGL